MAAEKDLGIKPTAAAIVSGTKPQQYELEAMKDGKEVAVHVLADGTVVKNENNETNR